MTSSETAAERVIDKFGGPTALARELGHRHPTTVHSWKTRGNIPQRHWAAVLSAAQRNAIALSVEDLVDLGGREMAR